MDVDLGVQDIAFRHGFPAFCDPDPASCPGDAAGLFGGKAVWVYDSLSYTEG